MAQRKRKRIEGPSGPRPKRMTLEDLVRLIIPPDLTRSRAFEHLQRSQLEFLKALRALLEERITCLEKRIEERKGRRVRKIEIEAGQ